MKLIEFVATEEKQPGKTYVDGIAKFEFQGKIRELEATQRYNEDGTLYLTWVKGFAYKYYTGKKVWYGQVTCWPNGNVQADAAGYDGNIRGRAPTIIGIWADMPEAAMALRKKI